MFIYVQSQCVIACVPTLVNALLSICIPNCVNRNIDWIQRASDISGGKSSYTDWEKTWYLVAVRDVQYVSKI